MEYFLKKGVYLKDNNLISVYAQMLFKRNVLPQDKVKSARYFKMCGDLGNNYGMRMYADCLSDWAGVEKNRDEALKLYKMTADCGNIQNDDLNQNEQQNRICLYSDLQFTLNNLKNEFSNRFSMLEKEICSINIHLNSQIQNSIYDVNDRIKKLETNEKDSFDEKSEKTCSIKDEIINLKN